jgi:hypothetical protein
VLIQSEMLGDRLLVRDFLGDDPDEAYGQACLLLKRGGWLPPAWADISD